MISRVREIRKFIPGLVASCIVIVIVGILLLISMGHQKAPEAVIDVSMRNIHVGDDILFSGNRSMNPNGLDADLKFTWTIDGKMAGEDVWFVHSFDAPGEHIVTLRVIDPTGRSDAATISVLVGE